MLHLNSIELSTKNLYEAAFRLRQETGFGFYDGGWNPPSVGDKIFPLGSGAYVQMRGLIDPYAAQDPAQPGARRMYEAVAAGDVFDTLALRVDTAAEIEAIAKAHGLPVPKHNPGGRIQADGEHIKALVLAPPPQMRGAPQVYWYDEMWAHPSGQPVDPAPGLVKPRGIAWVEYGGSVADLAAWVGPGAADLPVRFNGKAAGLYAVGVRTDKGEVVIRRKSAAEA